MVGFRAGGQDAGESACATEGGVRRCEGAVEVWLDFGLWLGQGAGTGAVYGLGFSVLDYQIFWGSAVGDSGVDKEDFATVAGTNTTALGRMSEYDSADFVVGKQLIDVGFWVQFFGEAAVPERAFFDEGHAAFEFAEIPEGCANFLVDLFDGRGGEPWADSTVQKDVVVDLDDGVLLSDPFTVFAVGLERKAVFDPAWGMILIPDGARIASGDGASFDGLFPVVVEHGGGILGRERGPFTGVDIAKVAVDVHGFVVAH